MMMSFIYLLGLLLIYNKLFDSIMLSNFIYLLIINLLIIYMNMDWFYISFNYSLSFYSYMLILLSIWISGVIIMMLGELIFCINMFILLLLILLMLFGSMNILMFYFLFEFSLIIIFLMILLWGHGLMRYLAGYYFLFYTLFFSLPLLIFIFIIINLNFVSLFNLMELMGYSMNMYMFIYLLMAFLIKIPMFMFHGWLLKAHVEAPVFGSMMLASLLLKLGTYGLLRLVLVMYMNFIKLNYFVLMFSLFGGLYISVICLFQLDMKILVAYSSVVHMSMLLSAMMTMLKIGILGGYVIMLAHGLCSSGLFYLVNLCYIESSSRLMVVNKGMVNYNSILSMFWFMMCSSNMSSPISLNLVGEILMMMCLIGWCKYLLYLIMVFCFFSFSYSLYLFCYVQHGDFNFYLKIKGSNMFNYFVLIMHWLPLNLLFMNLIFFY